MAPRYRVRGRHPDLVVHAAVRFVERTGGPHVGGAHAVVVANDFRALPLDADLRLDPHGTDLERIAVRESRDVAAMRPGDVGGEREAQRAPVGVMGNVHPAEYGAVQLRHVRQLRTAAPVGVPDVERDTGPDRPVVALVDICTERSPTKVDGSPSEGEPGTESDTGIVAWIGGLPRRCGEARRDAEAMAAAVAFAFRNAGGNVRRQRQTDRCEEQLRSHCGRPSEGARPGMLSGRGQRTKDRRAQSRGHCTLRRKVLQRDAGCRKSWIPAFAGMT